MLRSLSFLSLFLLIALSAGQAFAQISVTLPEGLQPGDQVILIADSAEIYAYPDAESLVVDTVIKGYVDQLGPQTTSPEGWAFLSKSVGFIQIDDSVLAERTDALQAQLLEEATRDVEATPDIAQVYIQRGVIYSYMYEHEAALADFSHAIELEPDDPKVYILRGQTLRRLNQVTRSIADFEKAYELGDESIDTLTGIGRGYATLEMNFEATPWLQQATETYPDSYFAWIIMANNYGYYESLEARINDYNRAITINELGYHAYANRARLYHLDDQLDLALEEYQRVIDIDPYHAGVYLGMAYVYSSGFDDVNKTLEYVEQALAIDPNNAEAYALAATTYAYNLGNREKALQNFEMALQTNPTNINMWMEAYIYYSRIGQYERALEYNDVIISYEPIASRVYRDRAQILFAMGRYEEAYESLDIYWDDYSDYYQGVGLIQILRAIVALQESNYTYAAEQIDIAFTVTSWWPLQWNEMRGLRIYDSRSYLAQQYYQKTIDAPDFPSSYLQLGHIMVEFGQWEVALEHYRHYLSLVDDPDVENLVDVIASHVEGS